MGEEEEEQEEEDKKGIRRRERGKREMGRRKRGGEALMIIGSLCPISVEGVIRGGDWASARRESNPSHLITYGCSFCPPVERH
jgi:hypothetical protein